MAGVCSARPPQWESGRVDQNMPLVFARRHAAGSGSEYAEL